MNELRAYLEILKEQGKMTLLRTICGLHSEYDGDFLREGVVQKNKQRLKHSYMVMQDVNYQLFAENVEAETGNCGKCGVR